MTPSLSSPLRMTPLYVLTFQDDTPLWSQRREAKAIVKNVTVQPIKPVYVTLVFAWNLLAGILLLPQLQLLVCCIILPAVDLSAFLCNTVTS